MASIFTFDPDPPRVSSPWSTPRAGTPGQGEFRVAGRPNCYGGENHHLEPPAGMLQGDSGITKLEPEPQEGPVEYKLHLLLRPRRSFSAISTIRHVPGSIRSRTGTPVPSTATRSVSETVLSSTPPPVTSIQTRQHRLEQLTTQLLWRLQQSSPFHSSTGKNLILPQLPEATPQLEVPSTPQKLLPGLEESQGALYEIGVSDDGSLVGLAEDELEESLTNLRAMAASLGCSVEILRRVEVGHCEWEDLEPNCKTLRPPQRRGSLWVAEALVKPDLETHIVDQQGDPQSPLALSDANGHGISPFLSHEADSIQSSTQQLRVSLTGATMSGKSSLLGSLSTATLDNGRGKSRLSLLKHRHEIASGMTSSVTQELIGYYDDNDIYDNPISSQIINYASGNVSSWSDIHVLSEPGRLVFLSDSAGHPRYRRTTVRGLIGWAPHWTLLCIPADNVEDTSGMTGSTPSSKEVLGAAAADVDLSETHLELCLKLELPLVIVITKLDIASNAGLKKTLSKILGPIKAAGRTPKIVPTDTHATVTEEDLQELNNAELRSARQVISALNESFLNVVPIMLTSAVKGIGMSKLHALLHELPIPSERPQIPPSLTDTRPPSPLFHVEDVYNTKAPVELSPSSHSDPMHIVSGCLHYGNIHVGDELLLGPYPIGVTSDEPEHDSDTLSPPHGYLSSALPTSRSFPGALHKALRLNLHLSATNAHHEWRTVRIVSVRNLRLPVRALQAGQVGTIGIIPLSEPISAPAVVRIRKGMVLAGGNPKAKRMFVARFEDIGIRECTVGTSVVVYVASVRASAKVVAIALEDSEPSSAVAAEEQHGADDDGFGFGFDDDEGSGEDVEVNKDDIVPTLVTLQFLFTREFVEDGVKVLVMPGGGPGLYVSGERGEKGVAGLEGFVGTIVEGFG